MKVVVVNNLYPPNVRGGAERSVQLLAEALVRRGVEVTVVTTSSKAVDATEVDGVKVVTLTGSNLYWPFAGEPASPMRRKLWHLIDLYNPLVTGRLVQVIRQERAEIVHTNNLQAISVAAWRAAAMAGVPVLHTLRDYYLACARSNRYRDGSNCTRTCLECMPFCAVRRRLSAGLGGVVGTSRFILDRHLELGFFAGARVRRAIDNPSPRRDPGQGGDRRIRFGYLGRLEPAKGVESLVAGFSERTDENWELVVAGTGPPEFVDALTRRAAAAKQPQRIQFAGWTDAEAFLAQVDVVVVPSLWHEPFARSVIEAQARGLAVIASRRGGLTEMLDDGVEGLLFEPGEPHSLTQAVDRMLADPPLVRRMGEAAYERARRYDPDDIASQYAQAYDEVIAAAG